MGINDFNGIAPFYDRCSALIFGDRLVASQTSFFDVLEGDHHVLIAGGGTGKVLPHLPKVKSITFLDKSERMIELASEKAVKQPVQFQSQDLFSYSPNIQFDAILCPFFLDCFHEENLNRAIGMLKQLLKPTGHLLITDFELGSLNATLSSAMHLFFRIVANLEARCLQPIHQRVLDHGFRVKDQKFFYRNMIFSRVYRNL